jgi:hypothetical protein
LVASVSSDRSAPLQRAQGGSWVPNPSTAMAISPRSIAIRRRS